MGVIAVVFNGMGVPIDRDLFKTNRAEGINENALICP